MLIEVRQNYGRMELWAQWLLATSRPSGATISPRGYQPPPGPAELQSIQWLLVTSRPRSYHQSSGYQSPPGLVATTSPSSCQLPTGPEATTSPCLNMPKSQPPPGPVAVNHLQARSKISAAEPFLVKSRKGKEMEILLVKLVLMKIMSLRKLLHQQKLFYKGMLDLHHFNMVVLNQTSVVGHQDAAQSCDAFTRSPLSLP